MSDITPKNSFFDFMGLPTEIRLMVYPILVVSPNEKPLQLIDEACRKRARFNIQTGILYANKQTYAEACPILYAKNRLDIVVSPCQPYYSRDRYLFRTDTYSGGRRNLRSGRVVNTMTYIGVIYPHVLPRFRTINVRFQYVPRHNWGIEYELENILEVLSHLIMAGSRKERSELASFSYIQPSFSVEICKIMCSCPLHSSNDQLFVTMMKHGIIAALKQLMKYRIVLAVNNGAECFSDAITALQINKAIYEDFPVLR